MTAIYPSTMTAIRARAAVLDSGYAQLTQADWDRRWLLEYVDEQARIIRAAGADIRRIDAERAQAEREADQWKDRATERQAQGARSLNDYAAECRKAADRWHHDPVTGEPIEFDPIRSLMLIASEVFEAFEGVRKGLQDDHLPQYPMESVELVDVLIRVFDYAGDRSWDIEQIYRDKLAYNASRADHQVDARAAANGKKF